jgi:hypothetical protein
MDQFDLCCCGPSIDGFVDFYFAMLFLVPFVMAIAAYLQSFDRYNAMFDACRYVFMEAANSRRGVLNCYDSHLDFFIPAKGVQVSMFLYFAEVRIHLERPAISAIVPNAAFRAEQNKIKNQGFLVYVRPGAIDITKRLSQGEFLESWMDNTIEMALDLARLLTIPVSTAVQRCTDEHCAFCHAALRDAASMQCNRCGTPHHRECFAINGHCSVFGCM